MKKFFLIFFVMFATLFAKGQFYSTIYLGNVYPFSGGTVDTTDYYPGLNHFHGNVLIDGNLYVSSIDTNKPSNFHIGGDLSVTGITNLDETSITGTFDISRGGNNFSFTDLSATLDGIGTTMRSNRYRWYCGIYNLTAYGMTSKTFLAGFMDSTTNDNKYFRADSVQVSMSAKNNLGKSFAIGLNNRSLWLAHDTSVLIVSDSGIDAGTWWFKTGHVRISRSLTWDHAASGGSLELDGYFSGTTMSANSIVLRDSAATSKIKTDTLQANDPVNDEIIINSYVTANKSFDISASFSANSISSSYVGADKVVCDTLEYMALSPAISSAGYNMKVVFRLTQTGTAIPIISIVYNSTGATFTMGRSNTGIYSISSSLHTFTANKTFMLAGTPALNTDVNIVGWTSDTELSIKTYASGNLHDEVLNNTMFEITIYP